MTGPNSIGVAVVGVGGMGACHARNVAEAAGAHLVAVADPDETAGRALSAELNAPWLADGHEALAQADAVVIACPDRFHHTYVLAALERGLPVLCEKPLTVHLDDAQTVLAAEAEHGARLVQLGFMRVYDERHLQVKQAVASLGAVNHIRCVHRNTNAVARTLDQMLVESMIHDIHTVRWLAEAEITTVSTSVVARERGLRFVVLTCELASGGVAVIEFDDAATGYEVGVEVSADLGNVVAAEPLRALVRSAGQVGGEIGDDWFSPFLGTYRDEMAVWLESIRAGRATGPSSWDGYAAQVVVEAAVASHAQRGPVPVELRDPPEIYAEERL